MHNMLDTHITTMTTTDGISLPEAYAGICLSSCNKVIMLLFCGTHAFVSPVWPAVLPPIVSDHSTVPLRLAVLLYVSALLTP